MRAALLLSAPVLFLCLLLPLEGAAAEPAAYAGRFEIVDLKKDEAARDVAVDEATEELPSLFHGVVRKRLRKVSTVTLFFVLEPGKDSITISSDRSNDWKTDLSGTETEFTAEDGRTFWLSRWIEGEAIRTRVRSETGSRETLFELSEDGQTLRVTTTISNEKLPQSVVYRGDYRRVVSPPK